MQKVVLAFAQAELCSTRFSSDLRASVSRWAHGSSRAHRSSPRRYRVRVALPRVREQVAKHAFCRTHKNGTWAVQKIIQCVQEQDEFDLIQRNLQPYTPALLLNDCQYLACRFYSYARLTPTITVGNYVVQGAMRFRSPVSDFIFDAMVDRCWFVLSLCISGRPLAYVVLQGDWVWKVWSSKHSPDFGEPSRGSIPGRALSSPARLRQPFTLYAETSRDRDHPQLDHSGFKLERRPPHHLASRYLQPRWPLPPSRSPIRSPPRQPLHPQARLSRCAQDHQPAIRPHGIAHTSRRVVRRRLQGPRRSSGCDSRAVYAVQLRS